MRNEAFETICMPVYDLKYFSHIKEWNLQHSLRQVLELETLKKKIGRSCCTSPGQDKARMSGSNELAIGKP